MLRADMHGVYHYMTFNLAHISFLLRSRFERHLHFCSLPLAICSLCGLVMITRKIHFTTSNLRMEETIRANFGRKRQMARLSESQLVLSFNKCINSYFLIIILMCEKHIFNTKKK